MENINVKYTTNMKPEFIIISVLYLIYYDKNGQHNQYINLNKSITPFHKCTAANGIWMVINIK